MSEDIVRLGAGDFEELMEFLGAAFGQTECRFDRLLPTVYRPDDVSMGCNLALRRHGDLAAVVGVFPRDWQVGGQRLRVAGIGGVSTASQYRGRGFMRHLMAAAMERIAEDGYDASLLAGNRQRYGYWGYERCGTERHYQFGGANIKHGLKGVPELSVHALGQTPEELRAVQALLHQQPEYVLRPLTEMRDSLRNWRRDAFVGRDAEGAIRAALSADPRSGEINELLAADADAGMAALHAWSLQVSRKVKLTMPPLPSPLSRRLAALAERTQEESSGNWLVCEWPRVIRALLELKHQQTPLRDGRVVLGFTETTAACAMSVDGARLRCEPSDEEPLLRLAPLAMHRLLFGPLPPDHVVPLPPAAAVLRDWCPLPLFMARPDRV